MLWNMSALFGIVSIMSIAFGLVYGMHVYGEYSFNDFKNINPITPKNSPSLPDKDIPHNPSLSDVSISFPKDFVKADLTPPKPVSGEDMPLAALNVSNPAQRALFYRVSARKTVKNMENEIISWTKKKNPEYVCNSIKKPKKIFNLSKNGDTKFYSVTDCVRKTNATEKRISQKSYLHNTFFTLNINDDYVLFELFSTGSEQLSTVVNQSDAFLEKFIWKSSQKEHTQNDKR